MAATSSKSSLGECSIGIQSNRRELQPWAHIEETTMHDIFLSHSGAQKGFVKGIYRRLSPLYSTFFDITNDSLPPGEIFSTHIFDNAKKCKLAVVVLSKEFVSSKWPMLELAAFVDAMSSIQILPLFYHLSPRDIKDNLNTWCEKWQTFAVADSRINVPDWIKALKKVGSIKGLCFDRSEGDEAAYLDKIVSSIWKSVPPTIKCDDIHIFGKDRLCKLILNKFGEMEYHGKHMESYNHPKPCVLGMYGLPGSGKSTLSKRLVDYFFSLYGGKVLYLELPTPNPSPMDLINIFKELLNLTDFRNMINLDKVSDLSMVFYLLKRHGLQNRRIFVVVDNIVNDISLKAVKEFLDVGVGPGSKVLLVARTLDFLQEALVRGKQGRHFISDSMCVPRISQTDAVDILLHSARGGVVGGDDHAAKTIVDIVRMCGFGPRQDDLLYLPLAMEAMGVLLMRRMGDVKEWKNVLSARFSKKVRTCREEFVVKELVGASFEELSDEELQLLFLDVTLFLLPLSIHGQISVQEACDFLKVLHPCSSQESMEIKIKELERHCFLMIDHRDQIITVHDVYVEFAQSIQADPNFRLSSSGRRWLWMDYKCAGVKVGREMVLKEEYETSDDQQVRTMIVEVGEGCERVAVHGFEGLKALVVRNCKSLAVLELAGLTSLVSMSIQNCPRMRQLDSHDCDFNKVKRFNVQERESSRGLSTLQGQQWKQLPFHGGLQRMIAAISSTLFSSPLCFVEGIATQMRGLQVLRLEHTGIKRLMDMSSCWPQLRELYVEEYDLKAFEIGSLQGLNRIHFCDSKLLQGERRREERPVEPAADAETCVLYKPDEEKCVLYEYCYDDDYYEKNVVWRRNPRKKLKGTDLLKECPELEEVFIQSAFFEERHVSTLARKVRSLEIQMNFALKIPDLTQSAPSLEELKVRLCAKLVRVDFFVEFKMLSSLELSNCSTLFEVTGLGLLHNLRRLQVLRCPKLQTLGGFNNLRMLECIQVKWCSQLRKISDLSGLMSLSELQVMECRVLELREIAICNNNLNWLYLGELTSLEYVRLLSNGAAGQSSGSTLYELQSNQAWTSLLGSVYHILNLALLPKLKRVPGLQSLIHLQSVTLQYCPQLEELPPLHGLVELRSLRIHNCGKLKAVEGCDEMKSLEELRLGGCTSLECFVFRDLDKFLRGRRTDAGRFRLRFWGCKFASIEAMVAWALDANVPEPLRDASWANLAHEYRTNKLQVVEAFFPKLVSKMLVNEDDCFDCDHLVEHLVRKALLNEDYNVDWDHMGRDLVYGSIELVEKLLSMLERVPKQALLQLFESDSDFRFSIFDTILPYWLKVSYLV